MVPQTKDNLSRTRISLSVVNVNAAVAEKLITEVSLFPYDYVIVAALGHERMSAAHDSECCRGEGLGSCGPLLSDGNRADCARGVGEAPSRQRHSAQAYLGGGRDLGWLRRGRVRRHSQPSAAG